MCNMCQLRRRQLVMCSDAVHFNKRRKQTWTLPDSGILCLAGGHMKSSAGMAVTEVELWDFSPPVPE